MHIAREPVQFASQGCKKTKAKVCELLVWRVKVSGKAGRDPFMYQGSYLFRSFLPWIVRVLSQFALSYLHQLLQAGFVLLDKEFSNCLSDRTLLPVPA
mgnify:CR=1 FL=1